MNNYSLGSLVAFALFAMGFVAASAGLRTYHQNKGSKSGKRISYACISVFFWNVGYAWMSMCHGDSFAYVPRAIALLSVYVYMFCVVSYVAYLSNYPTKRLIAPYIIIGALSLFSWFQIIMPGAVTFKETPWGYWYTSKITPARIVQFACTLATIAFFYLILYYWKKNTTKKRILYIIKRFYGFGIFLFAGYTLDTLLPSLFHTSAVPGSCIGAFCSAMLLYLISKRSSAFGVSVQNVSEYVFRDVTTPVLVFDEEGRLELFNDRAADYFQKEKTELTGKSREELIAKTDGEDDDLYEVIGTDKYCRWDISSVKDDFGDILYIIAFVTDMTQERENMMLLKESRQEAENANQAKSNFLANTSHEIRTPMNAIIGMSEIVLQEDNLPEKARAGIVNIKNAGHNLLAIINDILDLSKIESAKYELIEEEYFLPSLISDVTNIISVRTEDKNLLFHIEPAEDLPEMLVGDQNRIRQVLINILGNAVKFTKEGSITFSISWNGSKKEPELCFAIKDTGIGIKEEDVDSIFGAFNQVDTKRNRNIQGTGLGLSISKHLTNLMGGDVEVSSTYGEGSTFWVTIKQSVNEYRAIGAEVADKLSKQSYYREASVAMEECDYPDANVLIVDDIEINLMIAEGVMEPYNMHVDTATSGKEAIQMVQQKDYDIIFMDHMMPELDGVDTTKMIRELGGKHKDQVIVALTANALEESKKLFEEATMQDFLAKPIELKALDVVLKRWLGGNN